MDIAQLMTCVVRYEHTDIDRLRFGKELEQWSSELRHALLTQLQLAHKLKGKLPTWAQAKVYIPTLLNLEQATREEVAQLKAQLFMPEGAGLVDMTGGLGVDFVALATRAGQGIYIEQSHELCEAAQYNFKRLLPEGRYRVCCAESLAVLSEVLEHNSVDLLYLDPARREEQALEARRVYAISDCTPSLSDTLAVLRALAHSGQAVPRLLVKLSPMLDITHTLRLYPEVQRVTLLSYRGELKELLLEFDLREAVLPLEDIPIRAYDILANGSYTFFEATTNMAQDAVMYAHPKRYIYEPQAGVMKSGLFGALAKQYGLQGLHQHTHIFTSDELLADFPGRRFECLEVLETSASKLKGLHKRIAQAEISCRNFGLSAEALRKKLKIKAGGDLHLMGVTLAPNLRACLLLRPC